MNNPTCNTWISSYFSLIVNIFPELQLPWSATQHCPCLASTECVLINFSRDLLHKTIILCLIYRHPWTQAWTNGHGDEDAGDEHKHLHISLHFHKLLKNSLLSMFFFSPYQITVHIVQCLDPVLLATSVQSAKLRTIISNTIVSE